MQTLQMFNQKTYQKRTYTLEDFLARVLALLENVEDSKTQEELYSLKLLDWLEQDSLNIYCLKTSKDCSTTIKETPSAQSSTRWQSWGMSGNTRCLTAEILESHTIEKEYSLSQILEKNLDQKYFLSEKYQKELEV